MAHHGLISDDPTFKSQRTTAKILRRVGLSATVCKGLRWQCGLRVLSSLRHLSEAHRYIIDGIIEKDGGTSKLGWAVIAMALAFLLRDLFNSLRIRINNHFEQNVIYDMRAMFAKRNGYR